MSNMVVTCVNIGHVGRNRSRSGSEEEILAENWRSGGSCGYGEGFRKSFRRDKRRKQWISDWRKAPKVGEPEKRYLNVVSNFGKSAAIGDIDQMKRSLRGLTAITGKDGDNGGPPCNPEILWPFVGMRGMLPKLGKKEVEKNIKFSGKRLKKLTEMMVDGYGTGDRQEIFESCLDFCSEIDLMARTKFWGGILIPLSRQAVNFGYFDVTAKVN
jgi:hypothetical protein